MEKPAIHAQTSPIIITGNICTAWLIRLKPAASVFEIWKTDIAKIPPASQTPQNPGTDGIAMKKDTTIKTKVNSGMLKFIPLHPLATI